MTQPGTVGITLGSAALQTVVFTTRPPGLCISWTDRLRQLRTLPISDSCCRYKPYHLSQSLYTETGPTCPSTAPLKPVLNGLLATAEDQCVSAWLDQACYPLQQANVSVFGWTTAADQCISVWLDHCSRPMSPCLVGPLQQTSVSVFGWTTAADLCLSVWLDHCSRPMSQCVTGPLQQTNISVFGWTTAADQCISV